jgi:hypothetical protein
LGPACARAARFNVIQQHDHGNRRWQVKPFFDDAGFDGELQRSIGKCDAGMASVGEALYLASKITNGVSTPRPCFADMRRYNGIEQAPRITCPCLVTDHETDLVSTGRGQQLCNALACPKSLRRFLRTEGAEGHCEGMAPIVFWTAAFDWLHETMRDQAATR